MLFHGELHRLGGLIELDMDQARAAGSIHHTFGVGDGFVILVDEWESPQQFEQFFARPDIQAMTGEMGASGPPEITIVEVADSPSSY